MSTHEARNTAPFADTEILETAAGDSSLVIRLSESEVAQQVQLARRFPRDINRVRTAVQVMATLDEDCAAEMMYCLPKGGSKIEGPSIRFAEIIVQAWGNNRTCTRIVDVNRVEKYVEAEGVFFDLETNTSNPIRIRRGIVDKYGKLYKPDMITQTGNAAASIAKRNAILSGIPKAVWRQAYDAARTIVGGTAQDVPVKRAECIAAFAHNGIPAAMLLRRIGVETENEITADHIVTLRGMWSAIRNGEATKEEMFPAEERPEAPAAKAKQTLDDVASGGKASGTPTSEAAYADGYAAVAKGITARAVPAEYRRYVQLNKAWADGHAQATHDAARAEDQGVIDE